MLALALAFIRRERSFPDRFTKNYIGTGFLNVEEEEEFDFLAADDLSDRFHGALAAGALHRETMGN